MNNFYFGSYASGKCHHLSGWYIDFETGLSMFGGMIAVAGFWLGFFQYIRTRRWERTRAATAQLRQLHEDPWLSLACLMLDWSDRSVLVPADFQEILGRKTMMHTTMTLKEGLTPHNLETQFNPEHVLYRDVFDRFYTYLEEVEHAIHRKLYSVEDVRPLRYWLEALFTHRFHDSTVFLNFAKAYNYDRVPELARQFGIDSPDPKS